MSLQKYSQRIRETMRGTNSIQPEMVMDSALRDAKRLKERPDLWPVLDIGCGEAYHVQTNIEHGIPTIGVDLDDGQLYLAQKRALKELGRYLPLVRGDARQLPIQNDSFGSVTSYGMLMMIPWVIEEIERKSIYQDKDTVREVARQILSEMKRVIRPSGEIKIVTMSDKYAGERKYFKPIPAELKELGISEGLMPLSVDYHRRDERFIEALFKK